MSGKIVEWKDFMINRKRTNEFDMFVLGFFEFAF